MRFFERLTEPKETAKAFEAFKIYRDLGADRTLKKTAEIYYGRSTANVRYIEEWSRRFDWVARAWAYDDWKEMIVGAELEKRFTEEAAAEADQRKRIKQKYLDNAELAADNQRCMLQWALERRDVVTEKDDEGRPVEVTRLYPARWSKRTAADLHPMIRDAAGESERLDVTVRQGEQVGQSHEEIVSEVMRELRIMMRDGELE